MKLKVDANFKGKLTCGSEINIGIRLIFMQAVESLIICTLMRSFCPKHIKFRWKNTEELYFLALKSDAKLKEKLAPGSKNDMRNLVNFHSTSRKSKKSISMGHFCPKYMRFELTKIQRRYLLWHWSDAKWHN